MNQKVLQLLRQLQTVWNQLGLNQRISVVVTGLAVIAGLLALTYWSSQVDYGLLYGRLDDQEAGRVVAALEELKIPYKLGQGGGAVYVPKDKVYFARMQLASKGIPQGDGVGFEIFDKPNFGISDFVQRANFVRAVQGELARTIAQLDQVDSARVLIVIPENRLLIDNDKKPTASVFVRTKGAAPLDAAAVDSIRFLVANAVEGLSPTQVTVVDHRGRVLAGNGASDTLVGLTSTQLAARRNLEQYLAQKAEGMLEEVLGPGQAVVRVAAEINFDQLTLSQEHYDPDGQVIKTSSSTDETVDTMSSTPGSSVVGVSANVGNATNLTAANTAPINNSKTKKKETTYEYVISKTTSNLTQLAGGVKRITAAVFVAARYEGTGDARKIVPRTPEELDKLKRIVQSALGIQGTDEITLEEIPFKDTFGEVVQNLDAEGHREFLVRQIHNAVYLVLALGMMFFFWRMLKRTPLEPLTSVPEKAAAEQGPSGGNGHGAVHVAAPGNGQPVETTGQQAASAAQEQPLAPGMISAEVLDRLVRENPDNFSQAIQAWLARGDLN